MGPPPTDSVANNLTDPGGVERRAPSGPGGLFTYRYRRFHLRLLTVFPCRGTGDRSNLFQSHWSNQWLTLVTVNKAEDMSPAEDHSSHLLINLKGNFTIEAQERGMAIHEAIPDGIFGSML